jgi:hypothetical protein
MLSDEDLRRIAPFELVQIPGERVPETWQELRQRSGLVPVLLGDRCSAEVVLERLHANDTSSDSIAEQGRRLDVPAWMAERMRTQPSCFGENEVKRVDVPWDGIKRGISPFMASLDYRGRPHPEVFLALVPAAEAWLAPAVLKPGGYNNCPDAAVHVAFFRYWFERHGAVLTTVADSIIELQVESPPRVLEAAHKVAFEHFVYCPDVVYEGIGTVGNLAGELLDGQLWWFWWP